jgi:hypothetical protein
MLDLRRYQRAFVRMKAGLTTSYFCRGEYDVGEKVVVVVWA